MYVYPILCVYIYIYIERERCIYWSSPIYGNPRMIGPYVYIHHCNICTDMEPRIGPASQLAKDPSVSPRG